AQSYVVINNPYPAHESAASYFDHTFGTSAGLMLAVNAAREADVVVWSQTLDVAANSDYDFGLWVSSWVSASPTLLDIQFNGTSLLNFTAPSVTAQWVNHTTTWHSEAATSLTISIFERGQADIGGDFALDDITLDGPSATAVPEPSTLVSALVGVGLAGLAG